MFASLDPLGLAETTCCSQSQWERRSTALGYPFNKVGGIECILDRFASMSSLNTRIAATLASLGISTAGQLATLIKQGTVATRLRQAGIFLTIYQLTKIMNDFGQAGNWCREEICVSFVDKVDVTYNRSWYNPCGWFSSWTYTVAECPGESTEETVNSDGEAVREPLEPVVLPDPGPNDPPLQWPRPAGKR